MITIRIYEFKIKIKARLIISTLISLPKFLNSAYFEARQGESKNDCDHFGHIVAKLERTQFSENSFSMK